MTVRGFESIKRGLAAQTIEILADRHGWSDEQAISMFMNSRVYDKLQDEETKVWHLSSSHLADMFEDEMRGELIWPEAPRWSGSRCNSRSIASRSTA